ncbi:uncharacterized protein VICG_01592 [Vittaforma corneae ATCC 50505]|uniref:Condensin complex subunit 1 C-terminal domain-containing protein n=1 Tax=Vittaforma corneae (strain ATCC 50505) TaxID=993615 RepID=L2GM28_VITCO|nr:uncharacterized protein VICG_01592 [Vittaforma corneae ATCC 50505]ELA41352.1 hypothetical protein VICG_01592 [Vittaforma corneae ATCC 50505]
MDMNLLDIAEIQSLIGVSEELTENVMHRIRSLPPSRAFLSIYNILLIERFESTLPLIEKVMAEKIDLDFLRLLQSSRFYLHRMAVPLLVKNLSFAEKKSILKISLKDEICEVVKRTVFSIRESNPFDAEELLEIALDLFKSKYTMVKILCVDILAMLGESSFLLIDLIKSTNWRMRLKVASRISEFSQGDQEKITSELISDPLDEVRIELARHLTSLSYTQLLDDPNELVRGNYLRGVLDKIEDEAVLRKMLEDSSWEVRKRLLGLKGEMFKKITIPLIRNKTENVPWRDKYEIFCLVEEKVSDEFTSKLLMVFLLKHIRDKVWEVRQQAQRILVKIVQLHSWIEEYFYELESLAASPNYLHRISVVPVVVEYDLRFKTDLGRKLKEDAVANVRERFKDYCDARGIKMDYLSGYDEAGFDTSFADSPLDTVRSEHNRKDQNDSYFE